MPTASIAILRNDPPFYLLTIADMSLLIESAQEQSALSSKRLFVESFLLGYQPSPATYVANLLKHQCVDFDQRIQRDFYGSAVELKVTGTFQPGGVVFHEYFIGIAE